MKPYEELPASAQAAYSEAYETAQRTEVHRSIAELPGSFQTKRIKGKPYIYYAYRDAISGKVRQIYVGPQSPAIEALQEKSAQSSNKDLARLAGAALALGCAPVTLQHYRIIRQLADAQFFRAGGILIGTHAYIAMGNLLGVRWQDAAQTQDIDFAHHGSKGNIALALPSNLELDVHSTIDSLAMGFLPAFTLEGGPTGTYISASQKDLRLDFLTPQRRGEKNLREPKLNIVLQTLKFLDYLIEKPTQAALLSRQGAIVVNIPDPARYALHKLIVASERPLSQRAKANKDVSQSATLLAYCLDRIPHLLEDAWQDIQSRGPGWRKRVNAQLKQMQRSFPEIAQRVSSLSK